MRGSKYDAQRLSPLVAESRSMAEVLRKLGLKPTGGNYRNLNARVRALGLDTSHFTGQRWNAGLTSESSGEVERLASLRSLPNEAVFVENCPHLITGAKLARRLVKLGWPYACSACGLTEWRGKPLTLHLDHCNGLNNDNRFENLRFLCPNCHQQTETWGNRHPSARNKRLIPARDATDAPPDDLPQKSPPPG